MARPGAATLGAAGVEKCTLVSLPPGAPRDPRPARRGTPLRGADRAPLGAQRVVGHHRGAADHRTRALPGSGGMGARRLGPATRGAGTADRGAGRRPRSPHDPAGGFGGVAGRHDPLRVRPTAVAVLPRPGAGLPRPGALLGAVGGVVRRHGARHDTRGRPAARPVPRRRGVLHRAGRRIPQRRPDHAGCTARGSRPGGDPALAVCPGPGGGRGLAGARPGWCTAWRCWSCCPSRRAPGPLWRTSCTTPPTRCAWAYGWGRARWCSGGCACPRSSWAEPPTWWRRSARRRSRHW